MSIRKRVKKHNLIQPRNLRFSTVLFIVFAVTGGIYAINNTHALTQAISVEAETGTLAGAATVKSSSSASNSGYIQFGSTSVSSPQIDQSSPAVIGIPGSTCSNPIQSVTTPSFSPPANSRIYVVTAADSYPTGSSNCLNETVQNSIASINSTSGSTWTRLANTTQRNSSVGGFVDVWSTMLTSAQANMTITTNFTAPMKAEPGQVSPSGLLKVIVVDNAATSQTSAPVTLDQLSSMTSSVTANLSAVPADSLSFLAVDYWNSYSTPPSVPGGQAIVANVNNQGETDTWTISDVTSASAGSLQLKQMITDPNHPNDNWHAVAWTVAP